MAEYPQGVDLPGRFYFFKNGILADPSPLPTITERRYQDGSVPISTTPDLTHTATGVFDCLAVFGAAENNQNGTNTSIAHTTDTTVDTPNSIASWDVGINSVSSLANAVINQIWDEVLTGHTTPNSAAILLKAAGGILLADPTVYASNTVGGYINYLLAIYGKTALIGAVLVARMSPVADDGTTTEIYISRDYLIANGQQLIYPIPGMISTDTIKWNLQRTEDDPLEVTGTYDTEDGEPVAVVQLTKAQTVTLANDAGFERPFEIVVTNLAGYVSQRVVGIAQIKDVVVR